MPDIVRLRNKTAETLIVAPLGQRRVDPDAVISIPADVYGRYAWPDETWAVVAEPRTTKTSKER